MLGERIRKSRELISHQINHNSNNYKPEKQYKTEFPFLKEVDSKALQSSTRNLLSSLKNYFNRLNKNKPIGFPKFKSSKNKQRYTTYNINNNIKINFDKKRLKLPKIKTWIKFRDIRVFNEKIKHLTVSKTKSGKYFASILVERILETHQKQVIHENKIIAFDMSASNFLVSEKAKLKNPSFFRKEEKRIKLLHKRLSRKKTGSSNHNNARIKLSKKYEKIFNRKLDWTHKISYNLAKKYNLVILEDLNIKGMQHLSSGLSKSVTLDFSWNKFVSILRYKMKEFGNHLILVDRWFPSSKLCSNCGWKNVKIKLSTRIWKCQECDSVHDRDINASINIRNEGIKKIQDHSIIIISTVGTTGSQACEDEVRLLKLKQSSMKQESNAIR